MQAIRRLWQPLEWSQNTISPLGILSLLMICFMVFNFLVPINFAEAGWKEAVGWGLTGLVAIGQGAGMIAGGIATAGAVVASAPIIGGAVVVAAGVGLVGIGVVCAIEAIVEDKENPSQGYIDPSSGSCSSGGCYQT